MAPIVPSTDNGNYNETDPIYSVSPAAGITEPNITNWDTAYGWGNHATAGYETTTQLNARDTANRNRANHTGTQLAATISDIGTTISANTDVAANTAARHAAVTVTDSSEIDFTLTGQNITASLINGSIGATRLSSGVNTSLGLANTAVQPSTIGVTVQGYSAILAGTTASFTTADESKLDGIQAGAQVNNISDVNATDLTDGGETTLHIHDGRYYTESETNALINNAFANPTFTGLLTTPTLRLNGTAVIVNNSAPTVRSDGSALVAGDLWWNPSTGGWGGWYSPYWLSPNINWTAGRRTSGTAVPNYSEGTEWNYALGQQTFVSIVNYACTLATAGNANNYYNFSVRAVLRDNTTSAVYTSSVKLFASGSNVVSSESVSVLVPVTISGIQVVGLSSTFVAVGAPPTISNIAHSIGWRLVL